MKKLLIFVKRLTKLVNEFQLLKEVAPEEFISKKYAVNLTILEQDLYNNFLFLMKHKDFLDIALKNFWHCYKLHLNSALIIVLVYVIIFILSEENWEFIAEMLVDLKFKDSINVAEYFTIEDNVVDTTQAACKVFDNEYVLENVVNPLLANACLIEKIVDYIKKDRDKNAKPQRKITCPVSPKLTNKKSYPLIVPANSIEDVTIIQSNPPMKRDELVIERLNQAYQENREKAINLLEFARENAFNCAKTTKKVIEPAEPPMQVIRHRKPPPKRDVVIKATTSSLLREAACLAKDKESEMQKIEALMQGAFDPTVLEKLEKEICEDKEQHNLQEIERKHLQGLLTYEEAKIAKQCLLQENKCKMEEFKKEKLHILQEIQVWKEQEQEKIKVLVEKCQSIEKAAREAEEKLLQSKKMRAKMVETETKNLLKEAYERQQHELAQKVELIQELRALQQVRTLQVKEFDPTECPNFGFLCEMSIAELQERLALLKVQMQEELEQKRCLIMDNKKKQQEMIDSVKRFVENNKPVRVKRPSKTVSKLQLTPEIIAMRERLQNLKCYNRDNESWSTFSGA